MTHLYIFKKKNNRFWGYEQYPQNHSDIFHKLYHEAKRIDSNEQILIHRENNQLSYAYIRHLGYGQKIGIGLTDDRIFKDINSLFALFRTITEELSKEELILKKRKAANQYKLTGDGLSDRQTQINLNIFSNKVSAYLGKQFAGAAQLPPANLEIAKEDVVIDSLQRRDSTWFVERIREGYHNVYISPQFELMPITLFDSIKSILLSINYKKLILCTGSLILILLWVYWIRSCVITLPDALSGTTTKLDSLQTVTVSKFVPENEQGSLTSIPASMNRRPNNYVRVSSGIYDFYIDKYEVTQKNYVVLMGNNPSKFQADSLSGLPVHGMSVRDAVLYCNKKSESEGYRGFYDIEENGVRLRSDGNGYRLPTEREWILASKKTKDNANDKPYFSHPNPQDVKRYDFKPHTVGEIPSKRRELFDVYGNVSELCVRDNGEIWGKGGSYRIALDSETSEEGGLKVAENLSSTRKLNPDFGMRLVFVP